MKPIKGADSVQIPLSFDGKYRMRVLNKRKFLIASLILFAWFLISILCVFFIKTLSGKILWPISLLVVAIFVIRFIVIRDGYFKKKFLDIKEHNYEYDYNTFWNIYDIQKEYPYMCRFVNGHKAVFVRLEKDVIVGRDPDNDYYHYEAIADALNQMAQRNIDCMHIDYMDMVGKDSRMANLFDKANDIENPDLKEVIVRMFNFVEKTMENAYASYDVYCFYGSSREDVFWGELQIVLSYFQRANYVRAKVLDKKDIGDLVTVLFPVEEFSVNDACERLFSYMGETEYLRPIWVERDKSRKILNKTREELEEVREVELLEKQFKKKGRKKAKDKDAEIDLFS